jgi:enoyl-CoA hydratase
MDYKNIIVEKEESYAIITINRPPANAISAELMREIGDVLSHFENEKDVKSLILTGSGDKIFCAGADLAAGFTENFGNIIDLGHQILLKIERYPKPVICAIQGHALGGGCEIALCCHFRIMKETATIGLVESNLGIIPGYGGTLRLPRIIGRAKALEYIIFGTRLSAEEALKVGLINSISKEGETLSDAKNLAKKIATRAPLATKYIIDCVSRGMEVSIEEAIQIEKSNFLEVIKTSDAREGIQAFFQKRTPQFKGE